MRTALLCLALLPAACNKSPQAQTDPKFEQQWATLQKQGTDPLYIERQGKGAALLGEVRRAVEPTETPIPAGAPAVLPGELPDYAVAQVVRRNLNSVNTCYEQAARESAVGSGKAIVSLDIATGGNVSDVKVDAPAFQASKLSDCVSARARNWTFPKFATGPKHVSYPFVFVGE